MRYVAGLLIILTLAACSHRREREAQREREERDRNSAAFKAGEAAHEIAEQAATADDGSIVGRVREHDAVPATEDEKQKGHGKEGDGPGEGDVAGGDGKSGSHELVILRGTVRV